MTKDTQRTAVVASCDSRTSAEAAVLALHHEGLDIECLSIDGNPLPTEQHVLDSVKAGEFLVLVHGTTEMIEHAHAVLGTTGSSQLTTDAADYGPHIATGLGMG
jgi:hypothetical protein